MLYEVLDRYNHDKLIIIELYKENELERFIYELYNILIKYSYRYYFISDDKEILEKLKNNYFNKIGTIIDNNSNISIIKDYSFDDEITDDDNIFLITEYPEKIRKKL